LGVDVVSTGLVLGVACAQPAANIANNAASTAPSIRTDSMPLLVFIAVIDCAYRFARNFSVCLKPLHMLSPSSGTACQFGDWRRFRGLWGTEHVK